MYTSENWKPLDDVFHEDYGYGTVVKVEINDLNNQVCYVEWVDTLSNVLGYELIKAQYIPEILRAYDIHVKAIREALQSVRIANQWLIQNETVMASYELCKAVDILTAALPEEESEEEEAPAAEEDKGEQD